MQRPEPASTELMKDREVQEALLRDAGGARPASDVDALIEQFPEINPGNYGEDDAIALNNWGIDAVAALAELREENARLAIHRDNLQGSRDYSMDLLLKYLGMDQGPIEYLTRTVIACAEKAEARIAELERERDALAVEFRKVEVLWKEAAIDASRKHDTIGGLENACRIKIGRAHV